MAETALSDAARADAARAASVRRQGEPGDVDAGRLAALHDAASAVRVAWDRLGLVRDDESRGPSGDDARAYIAALWQVQAAEEDYLRLREQLFGA